MGSVKQLSLGEILPLSLVSGQTHTGSPTNGNYVYDGNLKRVKAVVNGQTHYNVYDLSGSLVHVHAVNENKLTDYVSGPKGSLARISNDDVTYLHADHLGTPQAGTEANGALAWRQHYTPFGYTLTNPAANDNLGGFTGHIKDKATGLNYMQARYYDPTIGRFLSVDPVTFMDTGHPGMFNRYAYTINDPINMTDPDGRQFTDVRGHVEAQVKRDTAMAIFKKHHAHAKNAGTLAQQQIAKGDFKSAGTKTDTDKFEHFMANFETVEELGEDGAVIAKSISDQKELLDRAKNILTLGKAGNSADESAKDQTFNVGGREASEEGLSETEAAGRATDKVRESNKEFIPPPEHD